MLEGTPDRVVGRMPVAGNTQPYGLLHGGASVVLAETLGSIGAALHAGPERIAVGLDINATHHRGGAFAGSSPGPRRRSRSAARSRLRGRHHRRAGRRICTCRITCLMRAAAPGA